jgi:hypothetical protein
MESMLGLPHPCRVFFCSDRVGVERGMCHHLLIERVDIAGRMGVVVVAMDGEIRTYPDESSGLLPLASDIGLCTKRRLYQ